MSTGIETKCIHEGWKLVWLQCSHHPVRRRTFMQFLIFVRQETIL